MRELSNNVDFNDLLSKDKKRTLIEKLRIESDELIKELVKYEPEELSDLRALLLLRNESGCELENWQIQEFLSTQLPYHILAVNSLYLHKKREREANEELYEKELGVLRAKAEDDIISYRIGKKKEGYSLSGFGQITKDALMDRIRGYEEYEKLRTLKGGIDDLRYEEEFLKKLVDVLENRRYELGKILEIALKGL